MFLYPHAYTPTEEAQSAARALMARVRRYMAEHPDSELHRRGKMFGVLICRSAAEPDSEPRVLHAFSAMLDGSYYHEGFVPPIFEVKADEIIGENKEDSRRKQQWLFEQYKLMNARGHVRTILECFADESSYGGYPPSGTGECCAPKLLQACYQQGLMPVAMAEFWMGASPKDEIRREGEFYPACIAKCRPLLRHMLAGIEVEENPLLTLGRRLAAKTRILYEDDALWVVSKPGGLLTVPGREGQYSLVDYLGGNAMPAHRLDMDTSGIVLVAKTEEAYTELQRQFQAHEVEKMYVAVLQGDICRCSENETEGVISLPLIANPLDRPRQIVDWQHGKRAVTRWRLRSSCAAGAGNGAGTVVELYPETGRTHQLRVHCAHPDGLGMPIVGDRLYGSNKNGEELMLHATSIRFTHPVSGEVLTYSDEPEWL